MGPIDDGNRDPADWAEHPSIDALGTVRRVYLERPVEGWTYGDISGTRGEVDRYIHESRGMLLVVTDDDISRTFTFPRALPTVATIPI